MSYESKLIVVKKWNCDDLSELSSFGETILELNLYSMPNAFFPIEETFENELSEGFLYMGGKEVFEDKYGEKLRYTSVEKLLKVLYKCEIEEHYRRTELAINTLKSFTTNDWDNIVVFHYGY